MHVGRTLRDLTGVLDNEVLTLHFLGGKVERFAHPMQQATHRVRIRRSDRSGFRILLRSYGRVRDILRLKECIWPAKLSIRLKSRIFVPTFILVHCAPRANDISLITPLVLWHLWMRVKHLRCDRVTVPLPTVGGQSLREDLFIIFAITRV